jgi:hypothetical protein
VHQSNKGKTVPQKDRKGSPFKFHGREPNKKKREREKAKEKGRGTSDDKADDPLFGKKETPRSPPDTDLRNSVSKIAKPQPMNYYPLSSDLRFEPELHNPTPNKKTKSSILRDSTGLMSPLSLSPSEFTSPLMSGARLNIPKAESTPFRTVFSPETLALVNQVGPDDEIGDGEDSQTTEDSYE